MNLMCHQSLHLRSADQVAIELALSRVGNWRKRKDRLALILYFLAGELEGGGPYGSIPMFCHPPHLSVQREQETNALATINFDVCPIPHVGRVRLQF
eukprot:g68547.t1